MSQCMGHKVAIKQRVCRAILASACIKIYQPSAVKTHRHSGAAGILKLHAAFPVGLL